MLLKDKRKPIGEDTVTDGSIIAIERSSLGDYIWASLDTGYEVRLDVGEIRRLMGVSDGQG